MSSIDKFLSIADQFLESDASVVQLSQSFSDFLKKAKLGSALLTNEDRAVVIETSLKYLHCIIEYAGRGSARARSAIVRQLLCNKICPAMEDLKIKHEFIKNLSLPIFEILFGQPSWIAKEVLRMYIYILQNSDRAVRLEVVQEKGPYYLGRLMDAVAFGDFEFQVLIVETLYKICTKEILNNMPEVSFLTKELTDAFHEIDTDKFDLTVRIFLNRLNEMDEHVVSLLCYEVTFDDIQLQEPAELSSFKGMWVDFNVTAGTITFFLNNGPFHKDNKWEMVTIFPENISKSETSFSFNRQRRKKEGIAKLFLKGPCQLCYAPSQHKLLQCRLLALHSIDTGRFREVFQKVFPKIHKKVKTKQPLAMPYKKAYKPLDIVSVKSSTTNPSTTLNNTLDSNLARKKHRSTEEKSVTFADSTIHTSSSKSKSISSRRSTSIEAAPDDISLLDYKIKNLEKSKSSAELDEISWKSNLSVLELIETGKNVVKVGTFKKFQLSGLEELNDCSDELGASKDIPYSKYDEKFISKLMEMDENVDILSSSNKNFHMTAGRKVKSILTQKEADSTTPVEGLYSSEKLLKDEPLASDVFHSIEDIDNDDIKECFEAEYGTGQGKMNLIFGSDKNQDNVFSENFESCLHKSLSVISEDYCSDSKKNKIFKKEQRRKPYTKNSRTKEEPYNVIKERTGIYEKARWLGMVLSPDLFACDSQEHSEDVHRKKPTEIPKKTFSKTAYNVLVLPQEPPWIDPVRDCQVDEFDKLKLERPKEVHLDNPKDKKLAEPDLIQISQPRYQSPLITETEIFETAKMNLDSEEVEVIQWSGKNLDLFLDISQENHKFQSLSQENSPEADFSLNKEYTSKLKILSNIQIQSPNSKSQLSGYSAQTSQNKNSITQQRESIRPGKENQKPFQVLRNSSLNADAQLVSKSPKSSKSSITHDSDEEVPETEQIEVVDKSVVMTETDTNISKHEKSEDKATEMIDSGTQITVTSRKRVAIEETIHSEVPSQEIQYSETQKTESQTTNYELKTSQKLNEVIPIDDAFPERTEDIQNDKLQKTSSQKREKCEVKMITSQKNNSQNLENFENYKEEISQNKRRKLECGPAQEFNEKLNIKDLIIKKITQSDSSYDKSNENKVENDILEKDKIGQKLSSDITEKFECLKSATKRKKKVNRKKRQIINPPTNAKKIRRQNDNLVPNGKFSKMGPTALNNLIDKPVLNEDSSPLSELKQLSRNEIISENPKIQQGTDEITSKLKQCSVTEMSISPRNNGNAEKTTVKNRANKYKKDFEKLNVHNENITQEDALVEKNKNVVIHSMIKITDKILVSIESDEIDDIPLCLLKEHWRNTNIDKSAESLVDKNAKSLINENIKSVVDENTKSLVDENVKSLVDENHVKIKINKNAKTLVDENTISLVDENTKSLVNKNTKSLVDENTKSPVDENVKSLVDKNRVEIKVNKNCKSLVNENTKLLVDENAKSIVDENYAKSQVNEKVKTVVDENRKSQINRNSEFQVDENTKSLDNENTKSLVNENAKSLVNKNAKSLVNGNTKENSKSPLKQNAKSLFHENDDVDDGTLNHNSNVNGHNMKAIKHMEGKGDIYQNDTIKQIDSDGDNGLYLVENCSFDGIERQNVMDITRPDKTKPHQSDKKSPKSYKEIEDEQYLLNKTIELFHENSTSPQQKKVNLSIQISEVDNNNIETKKIEIDELEKSMQLLFGAEVDEAVAEKSNPEIVSKNDKSLNITRDTTNSIIAGNVGILRRGRKLFDPENKEENFLTCSIIGEERAKDEIEEKQIEIQSKIEHRQKKPPKNKKDEECCTESKKIGKKSSLNLGEDIKTKLKRSNKSDSDWRKEKQQKDKSKRYSGIQKNQHQLSILEYKKYARKKRIDSFYDKVVEKFKSGNYSSGKSFLATPKRKKSKNEVVGKYELDFSAVHKTILEKKEKCALRMKHSSSREISEIIGGDGSKERHLIVQNQDDSDELIRMILKDLGALFQNIAEGTLRKPSPPIQKNLLAVAHLLKEC